MPRWSASLRWRPKKPGASQPMPGERCGGLVQMPGQNSTAWHTTCRINCATCRAHRTPDTPASQRQRARRATRLVSLHDPDARSIRKGRLGKPVEFGYKAQVVDNDDGVVLDHNVEIGQSPRCTHARAGDQARDRTDEGRAKAVTADRGYGEHSVSEAIAGLGVSMVALPFKGKPTAVRREVESESEFQDLVRWRTGSEGRISCLKRDFGWSRTRMDGIEGARTWCGHGVFNHNLVKIAQLLDAS